MIEVTITWRNGEITMEEVPTSKAAIALLGEVINKASEIMIRHPESGSGFTVSVTTKKKE